MTKVRSWVTAPIDWTVPEGPTDWLLGGGETVGERVLVWSCTVAGSLAVVLTAVRSGVDWHWWHWVLVLVVAVDVVGGVPANALATTKRLYHSPPPAQSRPLARLVRRPVGFTALHVHPLVLAAALPGTHWEWALTWYGACLVGAVAVSASPVHLQRPTAFAVAVLVLVTQPLLAAPTGMEWFGPLLLLKLVLAHAVREEPYRPGPLELTSQTPRASLPHGGEPPRTGPADRSLTSQQRRRGPRLDGTGSRGSR